MVVASDVFAVSTRSLALALLVAVAAAGGGTLFASADHTVNAGDFPTTEPASEPVDTGDSETVAAATDETATPARSEGAFAVRILGVEDCGIHCRDVTAAVENVGDETVEDATVEVTVSAGDERLWTEEVQIGSLAPGESFEATERVELGLDEVAAIEGNDGWVTVEFVVHHDGGTVVFTERRKVG